MFTIKNHARWLNISNKTPNALNGSTKGARSYTALDKRHKNSNSLTEHDQRFRQIKEKYASRLQNIPTKMNSISYIVSHNNTMTQYYHKSINDILNYKPTRPSNADTESRTDITASSSRLLEIRNKSCPERGAIDKSNYDGINNKQGNTIEDNGQINWSRLLIEQLNDMMKQKEEEMVKMKKDKEAREKLLREEQEKALSLTQKSKAVSNPATIRRRMANAHAQFNTLRNLYNSKNQAGNKQIANAHKSIKREVTGISENNKFHRAESQEGKLKVHNRRESKIFKNSSKKIVPEIQNETNTNPENVNLDEFDISKLRQQDTSENEHEDADEERRKIEQMRKQEILEFK